MTILTALGLMTRKEHERLLSEQDNRDYKAWRKVADERDDMKLSRDDMAHKYKKAITDLAAAREEATSLRLQLDLAVTALEPWKEAAIRDEEPAAAMRRKRQMDRDRKKGRSA